MQNKKKVNFKFGNIFFILIIIIFIFPPILPFLIIGFIFYLKSNKTNFFNDLSNHKIFKKIRESNPEIYELYKKKNNIKEKEGNKSKIKKSIQPDDSKKIISVFQGEQKPIDDGFSKKSKIKQNKIYKTTKKPEIKYEYNGGKSIWDDYDSVIDKIDKK